MIQDDIARMLANAAAIWDAALDGPRPQWQPGQEWADHWAERRKEERALPQVDSRMDDRAADLYYESRWGA